MIYYRKYLYIIFFLILLLNTIYSEDINLLEYPKEISQVSTFNDLNYFIDLDYFSICDINNINVNQSNLQEKVDDNQLQIILDNFYYDYYNLNLITENYDNSLFKDLYFDIDTSYIQINNKQDLNLDYNIDYFIIDTNNYFFVKDSNIDIYEYTDDTKEYNYLSTLDSNNIIYNLEIIDYNNIKYLFLANKQNGISIYNINDNNILDVNNHYLGSIVFNWGPGDYNTTYITSFSAENDVNYVLAVVNKEWTLSRAVFYKIEDILDLNSIIPSSRHDALSDNYLPQKIWLDEDQNKFSIPFGNQEKTAYVKYRIVSDNLEIDVTGSTNDCSYELEHIHNRVFAISYNQNKICSYDLQDFPNIFTLETEIDLNNMIYSLESNSDLNKLYALQEDQLIILDYNFEIDEFVVDQNISFNNMLNLNLNLDLHEMILKDDIVLNIGCINGFSKVLLFNDYNITYFTAYPDFSDFSLSESNIDYDLYNSDFNGDVTFSFNLYDYNINKNNLDYNIFNYNLNLTDNSTFNYNIINNQNVDLNTCTKSNNRIYNCEYIFNIKDMHTTENLSYNTYFLNLNIGDLNKAVSKSFVFDLTNDTGGGGGNNNNPSGGSPFSSLPIIIVDCNKEKDALQNNLFLLKKDYFDRKLLFNSFLLSIEDINFNLDLNKPFIDVYSDYNTILEKYNSLEDLKILSSFFASRKIESFNNNNNCDNYNKYIIENYLSKKVSIIDIIDSNSNILSKYYFVEIDTNNIKLDENMFFIDYVPSIDLIVDITYSNVNLFDVNMDSNNCIFFNKDVNYLLDFYAVNNIKLINTMPLLLKVKTSDDLFSKLNIFDNLSINNNDNNSTNTDFKINSSFFILILFLVIVFLLFIYFIFKIKKK